MNRQLIADLWMCSNCGHFAITTKHDGPYRKSPDENEIFCNYCGGYTYMNTWGTLDLDLLNTDQELMQNIDTLDIMTEEELRASYIRAVKVGVDAGIFDLSYTAWMEYHSIRNFPVDEIRRDLGFDSEDRKEN